MRLPQLSLLCLLIFVAFDAVAQNPDGKNAAVSVVPSTATTIDFSKVVVPIGAIKILPKLSVGLTGRITPKVGESLLFGTGFCLDAVCRFIVTNYHVGKLVSARKVRHQKIVNRYFATGPDDREATLNFLSGHDPMPYATKRDLALLELRWPIKGYHGLRFSIDDLEPGQEVDIYAFPYDFNPFRGLKRVTARFSAPTTSGLLAFDCDPAADKQIHIAGGSSGGIVVDRKTQRIVGILGEVNGTIALAVPVKTLVDFVSKVQPFVAVKTFPAFKNPGFESVDIYPRFEPQPDFTSKFEPVHTGTLQRRPAEPDDVVVLREKAQRLADSMRNFIAVQSYDWGSGDKEPEAHAEYEVKVVDSRQTFRRYPYGTKELVEAEFPRISGFATGANEWAELPKMLGTEYKLRIRRAEDTEINGEKIKVFQYRADLEDKLCGFDPIEDYVFFEIRYHVDTACHGEAWVNENGDIIRISESLETADKRKEYRGWHENRTVLTYGQIKIADEPSRLTPLTTFVESHNGKRIYWCRGTFSNYHLFASHSRLVAATQGTSQMEQK